MKISVIVPVYNVSRYIERCMDSVIRQTYEDIECIFVDDFSSDNSVDLISRKITSYSGPIVFNVLHHERNMGLSCSRNTGIKAASGDYLFFLDSDDKIYDNSIELLANLAISYPNVDIVQGSSSVIDGSHLNKMYLLKKSMPEFANNHTWLKKNVLERVDIPVTAWNKLVRRNFITANDLYFKENIIHEDEHWAFFYAKYIESMAFCKTPTYQHYIHEGSIMTSDSFRSATNWFLIINDFVHNIDSDMSRFQRKAILEVSFGNLVRIIKKSPQKQIDDLLIKQRSILKPCLKSARERHQIFELLLLSYNHLPKYMMKFLCMKGVKSIYLGILKYLV